MPLDTGVVPTGYSGSTAVAQVQAYTNELTYPVASTTLLFLNKGLEEVSRLIGGVRLWGQYFTVKSQTTISLNNDVQDIVSANFSMGSANAASNGSSSPISQGALVYPMVALEQAAFMDAAAGFPAVGFGPPQAYFTYQDFGTSPAQTLPAPPQAQLAVVAGTSTGTVIEAGVTYVNANGETTLGAVADITPTTTQQAQIISPPSYQNATTYNPYAGPVGGPYHLQSAAPIAIGTPFTLPNPLLAVTAVPGTNTATGAGTGGALTMQLYPAAMIGQVNIYYRARPLLWADITTNSWTNLDTSVQEAAVVWATIRVLLNRQRAIEVKEIWQPMFDGMIADMKESINRRTTPKSGQVRDVANRSFPSSPYWLAR
jgi:hypothetical protein